jgi:hypothetical protein
MSLPCEQRTSASGLLTWEILTYFRGSSGIPLGNLSDPVIDLGLNPNGTFRTKRSRSRKSAIIHTLVNSGSFETDPGDDLGQA